MAIQKRFIHFKKFSDFNSKKLSANEANTQYTVGIGGVIQDGEPDVLYQSYCWIKDTQQQWTHGQLYDGSTVDLSQYLTAEDLNNKQDTLVSGTNIKTINGTSVLGSGDIEIDSSIPVVEVSGTSVALTANQFTILTTGQTSTLTVTLNAVEDSSIYNEYMMQFSTGTPVPTVSFPSSIVWVETPVIEASRTYQVSIVDNKGIMCGWERTSLISFTIEEVTYFATQGMTWGEWVESDYNTGEFYEHYSSTIAFNVYDRVQADGVDVKSSNVIQENYEYTIG